jgi:hypothetical protein
MTVVGYVFLRPAEFDDPTYAFYVRKPIFTLR